MRISWHGNIVYLFGDNRSSNPATVLRLDLEVTEACSTRLKSGENGARDMRARPVAEPCAAHAPSIPPTALAKPTEPASR
jgi:hypothetical protein